VEIDEGDTLIITVTNNQIYPVTLHWCVSPFFPFIALVE